MNYRYFLKKDDRTIDLDEINSLYGYKYFSLGHLQKVLKEKFPGYRLIVRKEK